ncbi:MAG: response regulator transcription factor [Spirochaetales bacterium]|nr:response regulator transcription factor [Spirochaetales bacterium]
MVILLFFVYALTQCVHFAGLVMEFIQYKYPGAQVLRLYGPFLITFQVYVLFKNVVFFIAEFSHAVGLYDQFPVLVAETMLHCLFMLCYLNLATRIIPGPPRFWKWKTAFLLIISPLVCLFAVRSPSIVRLYSVVSTSCVLAYSALYFLLYRKTVNDPPCARPMLLFTALGNIAFVPFFLVVTVLKTHTGFIPAYVYPENLYLLAVGLANIIYDTPSVLFPDTATPIPNSFSSELSERETQIVDLIEKGLGNKQIAAELFLSETTVRNYISELFRRFNVNNRIKLMVVLNRHTEALS